MKPLIELQQAFRDSPVYRNQLQQAELSIAQLESVAKGLVKSSRASIEISAELSQKQLGFCNDLNALSQLESDDEPTERALKSFVSNIYEIEKARKLMSEQLQNMFIAQSEVFVRKDLSAVKESRRQFDAVSEKVDAALERYASKKQHVPSASAQQNPANAQKDVNAQAQLQAQLEQSAEEVSHCRYDFHQMSLQHAQELNGFQRVKRVQYLEAILGYISSLSTFYHQAYELLKELEPVMQDMSQHLQLVKEEHEDRGATDDAVKYFELKQAMQFYNPLTRPVIPQLPEEITPAPQSYKAGYLVKKGQGKLTTIWSRRWFSIQKGYLVYETRGKAESPTMAANLRLCSVKPCHDVNERRFCFELISPQKQYVLQAENAADCSDWVEILQNAIGCALNSTDPEQSFGKGTSISKEKLDLVMDHNASKEQDPIIIQKIAAIRAVPGNECCADCGCDQADWSSINLGILLCIECSGIHRGMGVQVSKVRSLTLDKWDPETYDVMLELGNIRVNNTFEKIYNQLSSSISRATPKTERIERERWIQAKYVQRMFVEPAIPGADVNQQLWDAASIGNFSNALLAIAQGASIDYKNPQENGRTVLMQCIASNQIAGVFFALIWNASIKVTDDSGWSPLHMAVKKSNIRLVHNLLKRRADCALKTTDATPQTPIELAMSMGDPELTTIMRLHQFELEQNLPAKKAPTSVAVRRSSSSDQIPPMPDRAVPEVPQYSAQSCNKDDASSVDTQDNSLAGRFSRMSPTKAAKNFFTSVRSNSPTRKSGNQLNNDMEVHKSTGGISSSSYHAVSTHQD